MQKTEWWTAKRLLHVALLLLAPAWVWGEPCVPGQPSKDAPAEIAQFGFMVGDHEVTLHGWTGSAWTPPRKLNARWQGWYGLQGHAIYDEWIDPDPDQGGLGVNVRMFDPQAGLWKMMWIATSGLQVQDLRAEVRDGVLTMWQVYPPREGWKAEFEIIDTRRWARVSYLRGEDGAWQPQYRLVATRVECVAP